MTLISVVTPVYNGEATIAQTVRSVLNQTYSNFELIIINDGSTDSTLGVLAEFHDSRIKIFSYLNSGLSTSRNRGIEHACGEFISFIDADDLWTPEKLESQLNSLRDDPDAVVSYSWTDFIDNSGNLLDFGIHYTVNGYVFPELLKFFFIGSGSNALIRRQAFEEVGRFDETLTSAEDLDMFLRLAARYPFTAVPISQILYRITDNSMSRNVLRQERETLKVFNRVYAEEPGKFFIKHKRTSYANLYFYLASHALRGTPNRQNRQVAVKFLWRAVKNDPMIVKRGKSIAILIFKLITLMFLDPKRARSLQKNIKSMLVR